MLLLAGWWWIAVSVIHALGGVILYSTQWQEIAQDGWFNVIAPDPTAPIFDREDAFWFMFLTPFLFFIGRLCLWVHQQKLVFPISTGIILTGTMLMGICLMPVSGIWLALPPSIILIYSSKSIASSN